MSPVMKVLLKLMDYKIQLEKMKTSNSKRDILNKNTENIINGQDISQLKMILYSGRDSSIVSMEQYLKVVFGLNTHYPEFAANQFFELIDQYKTQTELSYCGLTNVVINLNALRLDPNKKWKYK